MLRITAILFAIVVFVDTADARWSADRIPDDLMPWYSSQYNGRHEWCCDYADGHTFYGNYVLANDGDIEFESDGVRYHLPAYMVLHGPNPTGHAVWWYVIQPDGSHRDYCFAPGSGG